jgi:hypothetical protein
MATDEHQNQTGTNSMESYNEGIGALNEYSQDVIMKISRNVNQMSK